MGEKIQRIHDGLLANNTREEMEAYANEQASLFPILVGDLDEFSDDQLAYFLAGYIWNTYQVIPTMILGSERH